MVSIRWFLPQFWKDRNENTRQKLDHENEVMAYERRRWQRWVKRMRRRQKSCRSDCEPSEEGCSCCDSCRLPNIIRWAAPILRMVPHVASPGAASAPRKILLCSSWTLYVLSTLFNIDLGWIFIDFMLYCDERRIFLFLKHVLKLIYFWYCTSSLYVCIKKFFII